MKIENWQLVLFAVGAFAGIVLLDILVTKGEFKLTFPTTAKAQFAKSIAPELQREEQEVETPEVPYVSETEETTEDN